MSQWCSKPLGDVADVNWGNTSLTKASYSDQGFTAYSATGPDGFLPNFEHDSPGIVLSAIGAKCGKCFAADGKWTAIKNTITITPLPKVITDFRFLYYYLNREELWPRRGVGQPFIGLGDARKLRVPHPTLPEQKRIAEILDRAEALRAKRRAALAQLDTLTQSIFLDLFGDPVSNERKWKIESLEGLTVRITKGESPKWQGYDYQPDGALFVTSENVRLGSIDLSEPKFLPLEFHEKLARCH